MFPNGEGPLGLLVNLIVFIVVVAVLIWVVRALLGAA